MTSREVASFATVTRAGSWTSETVVTALVSVAFRVLVNLVYHVMVSQGLLDSDRWSCEIHMRLLHCV